MNSKLMKLEAPYRRTRIFPWQTPQTLHDSINIGVNPYPYILQTL